MKEREFQAWVIQTAQTLGWRVWHVPTPMRPIGGGRFVPDPRGAGLPDLILLHSNPPRLIFAECKTDTKLSVEQTEFLSLARAVGEEAVACACGSSMCESGMRETDRPIGVYVFKPGAEHLIETLLKSKVLS